jgi:hypothetical protein
MKDHMRAIVIEKPGGPEVLRLEDLKRLAPPEEESECLLLAAVSMGQRNTGLKPHCLVFGPEGFAGASERLA